MKSADKNPAGGLGGAVSPSVGSRGEAPGKFSILMLENPRKSDIPVSQRLLKGFRIRIKRRRCVSFERKFQTSKVNHHVKGN